MGDPIGQEPVGCLPPPRSSRCLQPPTKPQPRLGNRHGDPSLHTAHCASQNVTGSRKPRFDSTRIRKTQKKSLSNKKQTKKTLTGSPCSFRRCCFLPSPVSLLALGQAQSLPPQHGLHQPRGAGQGEPKPHPSAYGKAPLE